MIPGTSHSCYLAPFVPYTHGALRPHSRHDALSPISPISSDLPHWEWNTFHRRMRKGFHIIGLWPFLQLLTLARESYCVQSALLRSKIPWFWGREIFTQTCGALLCVRFAGESSIWCRDQPSSGWRRQLQKFFRGAGARLPDPLQPPLLCPRSFWLAAHCKTRGQALYSQWKVCRCQHPWCQ